MLIGLLSWIRGLIPLPLALLLALPLGLGAILGAHQKAQQAPSASRPAVVLLGEQGAVRGFDLDGGLVGPESSQPFPDAQAVAAGGAEELVWIASSGRLVGLDGEGREVVALDLALLTGSERGTEPRLVTGTDGEAWLGRGSLLTAFAPSGQILVARSLPSPVQALAFDSDEAGRQPARLAVAAGGEILLLDGASGGEVGRLALPDDSEVSALTFAGPRLWAAAEDQLLAWDDDGDRVVRRKAPGLSGLAAAGDGELWTVRGVTLERRDADGKVLFALQPFGKTLVRHLAAVPEADVAWVSDGRFLAVVAGGEVVDRLEPFAVVPGQSGQHEPGQGIRDLAAVSRLGAVAEAPASPTTPATHTVPHLDPGEIAVVVEATADTFLARLLPDRPHGGQDFLRLRSLAENRALVGVALPEPPAGSVLHSASLQLWAEGSLVSLRGEDVGAHRLLVPWSEAAATWHCPEDLAPHNLRPDCAERWHGGTFDPVATATTRHFLGLGSPIAFDVTADVARALSGEPLHGWLLRLQDRFSLGMIRYSSREGAQHPERRPRLVLVFAQDEPPPPPPPPPDPELPPDPATVAPPLDPTVATDLFTSTRFLYEGPDAIQTGVAPGTIERRTAAVLRGVVFDRAGEPLPGVQITVLGREEFGQTLSRADGHFDLAVNGGGLLVLEYARDGYLTVQRAVDAPWRDYAWAEDVVLVPLDEAVTTVTAGAPQVQVARGSAVADEDGQRQATLIFPPGTTAEMVLPDGTVEPLPILNVRATEYTVGEAGPRAMPGELPPGIAYTWAAELSADEAIAAGAESVRFSQPVWLYVENFLGFPVGDPVPVGYYDRQMAAWVGSPNGRVIEVLGVDPAGLAQLDIDGSGQPASPEALATLGVTAEELEALAGLYTAGTSLWRSPIPHFTPWDYNWPYVPPPDAVLPPDDLVLDGEAGEPGDPDEPPGNEDPEGGEDGPFDPEEEDCVSYGSVLECENQVLRESVPVVGAAMELHYQSDRQPGRTSAYRFKTRLSGAEVPASLKRIDLTIYIAGQRIRQSFSPEPNQSFTFTWDGREAYERPQQGPVEIVIDKQYTYDTLYAQPADFEVSWGRFPQGEYDVRRVNNSQIRLGRRTQGRVEDLARSALGTWDARGQGLGGWSPDFHHVYSPATQTLYPGSGGRRSARGIGPVLSIAAGNGGFGNGGDGGPAEQASLSFPVDVAAGPDGSLYVADLDNRRIRRVSPDGQISTFAGNGTACPAPDQCGDGGPATEGRLSGPQGVVVTGDGSVLIADTAAGCVRRVDPQGLLSTAAGSCSGGPGLTAGLLDQPTDIEISPYGGFYVADIGLGQVLRVDAEGTVIPVAGGGSLPAGDGVPALQALLRTPNGISLGPDGSLFIAESGTDRVLRLSVDGILHHVAGSGDPFGPLGDGGPARDASLFSPSDVLATADGSVYVSDTGHQRLRKIDGFGRIFTVAGDGQFRELSNGESAGAASLGFPQGMAATADGVLVLADGELNRILRVGPALPAFTLGEFLIPSEDGGEIYVFDTFGRHQKTLHALTGAELRTFRYTSDGLLAEVEDADGLLTRFERGSQGEPLAVVGPFGQRTVLLLDDAGYLSSILDPTGEGLSFTYGQGMMESLEDAGGRTVSYEHGTFGRLLAEVDPAGGRKEFDRFGEPFGSSGSVRLSQGGRSPVLYETAVLADGTRVRTVTDRTGLASRRTEDPLGVRTAQAPDGTFSQVTLGPDPRFGMAVPQAREALLEVPGRPPLVAQRSSRATLADPDNPLSLVELEDTVAINGRTWRSLYDGPSRTLTRTSPTGRVASLRLDPQGRPLEVGTQGLLTVRYEYRPDGLLAAVRRGNGADERSLLFEYDDRGRVAAAVDALGQRLVMEYDEADRPILQRLPDGSELRLAYDSVGALRSITPPGRSAHNITYNSLGLASSYQPPDGAALEMTYTPDQLPAEVRRPGGEVVTFHYDEHGRPIGHDQARGSTRTAYDPATGQVSRLTAPDGSTLDLTWQGPLLRRSQWTGDVAGIIEQDYDADLRLASQSVGTSPAVTYQYDGDSLLIRAGPVQLQRDPVNGLLRGSTTGATIEARDHNGFAEITAWRYATGATEHFAATYERDAMGRLTSKTETVQGETLQVSYGYDLRGRLETVHRDGILTERYTYDANGNRTLFESPGDTVAAVYDGEDRLLTYGDLEYIYTPAGELLHRRQGEAEETFQYDAFGNLLSVNLAQGTVLEYVHDAQGRRLGKKIDGQLIQGFLYGAQITPIAELDGAGQVLSRFIYAGRGHVPDAMERGGRTWRLITDHLGSVRLVVDAATGEVAQRLDYDSFGRLQLDTNPGFQPFGFAGGLYDRHTSLVRFGARDYDPQTGRFTLKDPLGFAGRDPNLYAYAHGDPVNLIDPSGQIVPLLLVGWGLVEIGLTIYDAYDFYQTVQDPCATLSDVALSGGGLALSLFTPGGGHGAAAKAAGRSLRGGKKAVELGKAGETAVRAAAEIGDKVPIRIFGRTRIPDGLNLETKILSEVKNVGSLSYTRQLRDFAAYAGENGLQFNLYVRPGAQLSGPLLEANAAGVLNILEILF